MQQGLSHHFHCLCSFYFPCLEKVRLQIYQPGACSQTLLLRLGGKLAENVQVIQTGRSRVSFRVFAATTKSEEPNRQGRAPPGVDTRIHWENEDEGWIGGDGSSESSERKKFEEEQHDLLGEKFADLIISTDSHYQFLGVAVDADLEEIKAAYRRLSKEYHPDTTTLPIKAASEKFMKLRDAYNILSNEETRRFYDWTLAQEAASLRAKKMSVRFEDPSQIKFDEYEIVPDVVDRLKGGQNLKLSDQAMTALTVDAAILVFTICCIVVYYIFFMEPK